MELVIEGWGESGEDKKVVVSVTTDDKPEDRGLYFEKLKFGVSLVEVKELIRLAEAMAQTGQEREINQEDKSR